MFSEEELEYLTGQWVGRLSTSQPDGTLQVNPVGFGVNRALGSIDIGGYDMSRSRKYRNVLDNGRAAFVVDDVYSVDPWRVRFLEIRGHAEAIGEHALRDHVADDLGMGHQRGPIRVGWDPAEGVETELDQRCSPA